MEAMTWDKWVRLPERERDRLRDTSDLQPQLAPYRGARVEVEDDGGRIRRFWVGQSTGWKPCTLEVHNARSRGGIPADKHYKSVRVVRFSPRA